MFKKIEVCKNGMDALKCLNKLFEENNQFPDLILSDLKMPVLNGFEFLDIFPDFDISFKTKAKVIVLTSSTLPEDLQNITSYKYDIVEKPLNEEKILFILNLISADFTSW